MTSKDVPEVARALAWTRIHIDEPSWESSDHFRILAAGKWKHAIAAYAAATTLVDEQLGRVLKALEASPHAGNTIVVIWSDHGWHLGEKQHWRKNTLWEESTRVPLVIAAPGNGEAGPSEPAAGEPRRPLSHPSRPRRPLRTPRRSWTVSPCSPFSRVPTPPARNRP